MKGQMAWLWFWERGLEGVSGANYVSFRFFCTAGLTGCAYQWQVVQIYISILEKVSGRHRLNSS
jgi:hypothetical protein